MKKFDTPWGEADYVDELSEDMVVVGTPSHGGIGIRVGSDIAKQIPRKAIGGFNRIQNGYIWFEEDCGWAIPIYLSEKAAELYTKNMDEIKKVSVIDFAARMVKQYYAELYKG